MIIYQDTKLGFLNDVANNYLQARIEAAFLRKTGSIPADRLGWGGDYSRFGSVLGQAKVADDIQVAIEYHCSPVGRSRIDVLLAGSDGAGDNGLIIELKAWDKAGLSEIENMVVSPIGGSTLKQHPNLQARQYKGMILRFNEDIVKQGVRLHPSAYLFNLYRREPEPLEDDRYKALLAESRLFLANDVSLLKAYLEELVPYKAKNDVLFLLEHGKWRPADELITRVGDMLDGNEAFTLIDEQDEAFRIILHQVLDESDRTHRWPKKRDDVGVAICRE